MLDMLSTPTVAKNCNVRQICPLRNGRATGCRGIVRVLKPDTCNGFEGTHSLPSNHYDACVVQVLIRDADVQDHVMPNAMC